VNKTQRHYVPDERSNWYHFLIPFFMLWLVIKIFCWLCLCRWQVQCAFASHLVIYSGAAEVHYYEQGMMA